MISNHASECGSSNLVFWGWCFILGKPTESTTMPLTSIWTIFAESFFSRDTPPKSNLDTKNGLKNDNNAFPFKHGVILGIWCQIRGRANVVSTMSTLPGTSLVLYLALAPFRSWQFCSCGRPFLKATRQCVVGITVHGIWFMRFLDFMSTKPAPRGTQHWVIPK